MSRVPYMAELLVYLIVFSVVGAIGAALEQRGRTRPSNVEDIATWRAKRSGDIGGEGGVRWR